ncbi:MAG: hypothetical protein PWP27_315 [Clostridiales bacterium]|nr:hypothetical protein [Clostridiales bacterium]MDK2932505.1 hypothetical protein [Clostridiales bacterium]
MNDMMGVGLSIICGYGIGKIVNRFKIPSVAGYIIAGLLLGQSFFGLLSVEFLERVVGISDLALALIAFSIGGELKISNLKKIGGRVFAIAFFEAITAFILVTVAMLLLKQPMEIALLLGAVASATAPAATVMVLNELRAKGPLANTLIAVVAIDDAICLMIYAIASSIAKVIIAHSGTIHWVSVMSKPFIEIFGSIALGVLIGAILTYILSKISYRNEVLVIILSFIILTAGLAIKFEFSALLTNMTLGIMVVNLSANRAKAFSVIESISAPIYTAFFVLAGARLQISLLVKVGLIGLVYTAARIIGKIAGASFGATISKAEPVVKQYIGFGLLSQIGVAVGLAIIISHEFPGTTIGSLIITVLLATTVITEIIGPLCTRYAVMKSGEHGKLDTQS